MSEPDATEGGARTIHLAVVDDQDLVRAGLEMILDSQPDLDVRWTATNGAEALARFSREPVDVVLMDISMPFMDGLEATRILLKGSPRPAVLVLTTFDSEENIVRALVGGASGFLLKDTEPEHLIRAVRDVAAGSAALSATTARTVLDHLRSATATSDRPPSPQFRALPDSITGRERQVLDLMARGLQNSEIAETLMVSPATVKTHITAILAKSGARDRVQAVLLARDAGLGVDG